MKIIGCYNKSVILTYIGICSSVVGMFLAINNCISIAFICLIISGICDLFDGQVARKCKRNNIEKEFGIQIDSLADIINFVIFPVILIINISYKFYVLPVVILYSLCGVVRLAWFNVNTKQTKYIDYYQGLPVTYIALILPVIYLINLIFCKEINLITLLITMIICAAFFVINIKVKKPKGIWYGIFGILAICVIVGILIFRSL